MKQSDSVELEDPKLYREIVGSLIYVMTSTRPDICYAATLLSQVMSKPTKSHMSMAKHVLRYLKRAMNYGLKLEKSTDNLESIFPRHLFIDLQGKKEGNVILNVDNQGAISLAKNPVYHQRTRYIDIKYHFITV